MDFIVHQLSRFFIFLEIFSSQVNQHIEKDCKSDLAKHKVFSKKSKPKMKI